MVWAWPLCLTCEARAGALATARPVASGASGASDASGVSVARREVNLSDDSKVGSWAWTAGRRKKVTLDELDGFLLSSWIISISIPFSEGL